MNTETEGGNLGDSPKAHRVKVNGVNLSISSADQRVGLESARCPSLFRASLKVRAHKLRRAVAGGIKIPHV